MDKLGELNLSIEENPNDPALLLERANLHFDAKEYEEALCDYNEAIKHNDKCAAAYIGCGNVHLYIKNDYDEALKNYNEAIRLDENNAEAYYNRGNFYYYKKECNLAIADYTRAIELDGEYYNAYIWLGNTYFYEKKYKKALTNYNKVIKLDKNNFDAYINRGNLRIAQRKYDLALEDFNYAIEVDGKRVDAFVFRGNTHYSDKNYSKALSDYNEAISLDPECVAAHTGLGNVYSEINDYKKARESFEEAIKSNEKYIHAHTGLGYLFYKDKDYSNAIKQYEIVTKLDVNNAYTFNDLGTIYNKRNDYSNALKNSRKATRLDNTLADAHYQCGIANYGLGSYFDAREDYIKAKELYKNEGDSFNEALLDRKIEEITGILEKPIEVNQRIKLLMDKIEQSNIKKNIKDAKKVFSDFIAEREIGNKEEIDIPELLVLRRWNSYTPIIADKKAGKETSKGGGYFFRILDYGIVIDPGFNFLENFIAAGYKFHHIDYILITHAHNDHTTDLESILTLLYKYNEEIKGDYDTHEEGTIMHDIFTEISRKSNSDTHEDDTIVQNIFTTISRQELNVKYEDKKHIEELAKKEFENSFRRKRICIYMSGSTFKKYASMLNLYENADYDVVLIKADDEIKIQSHDKRLRENPSDLEITAIKAKHNDLLSDRDSLGLFIRYKNFVLVYTGDTGYSLEIESQYSKIHEKNSECDIVLLAHLGGFEECEKSFDASKSVADNLKFFYKNHLGRLGLSRLVEVLKPNICIISEFGEEFRNQRIKLTKIFQEVYEKSTFFIPADIGLCINAKNEIRLVDSYEYNDNKPRINAKFYPYSNTDIYEDKQSYALLYHNKTSSVDIAGLISFLIRNEKFGIAEDLYRIVTESGEQ